MSALETARPAADSSQGTRVLWLSSGQPPASLVACLREAHVTLDVQVRRGSEPPPRIVWVARAPATASDRPDLTDTRIGVLHTDAGAADGLAQALRGAGAQVVLVSESTQSLKRMQMLEPDVLVVAQADLPGVLRGSLTNVWRHPILRWIPVLVCREALFGHAGMHAPELRHLAHTLTQVTRPAQQIVRTLEGAQRLVFPLTKFGPARPLSSLVETGLGLRVLLESPELHVEVDLAEGIVAGAQGTRRGEPKGALLGAHALAEMIHATTGTLRVRKVTHPAQTNVMAPLDAALITALVDHPAPQRPHDAPSHVSRTQSSPVASSTQPPRREAFAEAPSTPPRTPSGPASAAGLPPPSGETRVGVRKVVPVTPSGRARGRVGEPVRSRRTLSGVAHGDSPANDVASARRVAPPKRAGRTLLGVSAPSSSGQGGVRQEPTQASPPADATERPEAKTLSVEDDDLLEVLASQAEAESPLAFEPERTDAGPEPSSASSEGGEIVPPQRGAAHRHKSPGMAHTHPSPGAAHTHPSAGAATQTVDAVSVRPAASEPVPKVAASPALASSVPSAGPPPSARTSSVPGWAYALSATLVLGALAFAAWILRDDTTRLVAAVREGDFRALFPAADRGEPVEAPATRPSVEEETGEREATQAVVETPQETEVQAAPQEVAEGESHPASAAPGAGSPEPQGPGPEQAAQAPNQPPTPGADTPGESPATATEAPNEAADEGESVKTEKQYPKRPVPRGKAMLADADASLEAGRLEQARELYERAAELIPKYSPVHAGLARTYLRMERYEDALEVAKRVVGMQGNNGAYRILLGDAFAALDMDKRANTQWRKAYRRGAKQEAVKRLTR